MNEEKELPAETPQELEEKEFNLEEFLGLTEDDTAEVVMQKVQEKIGVSLDQLQEALSKSVQERAEELVLEMPNIAPLGDYEKLLEDNDSMADFLKTEGHKPVHWKLYGIRVSDINKDLLSFVFYNMGVDDGTTFQGFVFTNKNGKIKHAFAQVEE